MVNSSSSKNLAVRSTRVLWGFLRFSLASLLWYLDPMAFAVVSSSVLTFVAYLKPVSIAHLAAKGVLLLLWSLVLSESV